MGSGRFNLDAAKHRRSVHNWPRLLSHDWTLASLCFNSNEERQKRSYLKFIPAKPPFCLRTPIVHPLYPATPDHRLSACFPSRFL